MPDTRDIPAIEPIPLGDATMDRVHEEFIRQHQRLLEALGDEFTRRYGEFLAHTRAHFADEESRMTESACPTLKEHRDDHRRVLGEMEAFAVRVRRGQHRFARSWIRNHLPEWFRIHVTHMDSALAAHLHACDSER